MLSDMSQAINARTTEAVEAYVSSLQDLRANSKPYINFLTLLADENIEFASAIVEAIEAHLQKVQNETKLPVLYLIDSIIKNVKQPYITLFAKNIVTTFCHVFEKVDETVVRQKLWKLRNTWNDIFPAMQLYLLDERVHNVDRNWPRSAMPTSLASLKSKIHVNPKFLSLQQKQQQAPAAATAVPEPASEATALTQTDAPQMTEDQMREELLRRKKELLSLKNKRQKLTVLQQQQLTKHIEEHQVPSSSDLFALDGPSVQPIAAIVPLDVSQNDSKSPLPIETAQVTSEKKSKPSITPSDPRKKTIATLKQNGESSITEEDRNQLLSMLTDDSSLFNISPLRPSPTNINESSNLDMSQTDLSSNLLNLPKDPKSHDKDHRIRKSNSSSSSSKKSEPRSSTDRSPTKTRSSNRLKQSSSSSSTSSSRKSRSNSSSHKKSKSRKRSRSPDHHRHRHHRHHDHRHQSPKLQQGLDEEEQIGGALIISPPQPLANNRNNQQRKDSSSSASSNRVVRRFRSSTSRSKSPESGREETRKRKDSGSSGKDEDLRAALLAAKMEADAAKMETKKDLDLRVIPTVPTNKRQASDSLESPTLKKTKGDDIVELFGKEDVDLRLLTPQAPKPPPPPPPMVQQPPTPPPPVISADKDSWAKYKAPLSKTESSSRLSLDSNRMTSDRPSSLERNNRITERPSSLDRNNRERAERLERPEQRQDRRSKFYNNKPNNNIINNNEADRRIVERGREYETNSDRNIEYIMKQAAEQLNQGTITKLQYNKLIQEVLHMSEDQKLRAAQRKEREGKIWDKDKGMRSKELGMHGPRPPGPRWQQPWHQPWAHPPGPFQGPFPRPDFRPMGPWQNHPRMFGGPMRPDFHQFHACFNPRLGHPPMGPNGPLMLPNGPHNPMAAGPMNPMAGAPMSGSMQSNIMLGQGGPMMPKRNDSNSVDSSSNWSNNNTNDGKSTDSEVTSSCSEELPPADPKLLEEISKDTMRSINIDSIPREIRYYGDVGVIFMHWDDPRDIGFQNGARRITIDGKEVAVCSFNDDYREFEYEGKNHKIKLGAPTRELYIDDKWYQCYFGGQSIAIELDGKKVNVKLEGAPPQVKVGTIKRTDLVLGKINLIINARNMVPVFLDAKPQMFNIDNKPCTLEFVDALKTVLLNNKPFSVKFGDLPQPIIVQGKKHFIRFSVLPRGFQAGYVKITGMKGEQPLEEPKKDQPEVSSSTSIAVASPVEPDSTSQDGIDQSYNSKSDLHLDVLSSVMPSAMAPSSGLSYQAEPVENPPAPAPTISLPLNLSELFQRLVETGIVTNLSEAKKPEEEEEKKEPEPILVTFEKPETLKIKQPSMVTALYSGIQCSSCGARFAPEMAIRYSHHLDWHFRQNRKERDSSRKAHSRIWYYNMKDWIKFEEIEDLEDREQSWFETEKQIMESENAAAEELFAETIQPSVSTGSEEDSYCQVCREHFEQFYNDETEEWHLRPAISFEDKNFHPLCLEDHKRAMEEAATTLKTPEATDDTKDKMDVTAKEESQEIKKDDDTDLQNNKQDEEKTDEAASECETVPEKMEIELIENDVEKTEENTAEVKIEESTHETVEIEIELNDSESSKDLILEDIEDEKKVNENNLESTETEQMDTNDEPIDAINESKESLDSEIEETTETTAADSTQVEVKSTIDGNVELESASASILTATSKIKINIVKPIIKEVKEKEEPEEKSPEEVKEEEVPLQAASIKPLLLERNLSVLPPVEKGVELSSMCSVM